MPLEVIGAGFGRTGTLSLKLALERLGFVKCYHMMEVFQHPEHIPMWADAHQGKFVDWERLYDGYRATSIGLRAISGKNTPPCIRMRRSFSARVIRRVGTTAS